jgi:RHS repeat-associated protein
LGKQIFELSNHLGNVLATITDKKLQVSLNTTSTAYFEADVQTVQDYYAFGMQMPGRKLSGGYRYGFNGKENDNEMYGEGNAYNFEARIQDPRLGGRFLSLDPLATKYPGISPYAFCMNNPLIYVDKDGRDAILIVFPDYKIDPELKVGKWKAPKVGGLGHAGVLLIDNKTGVAKYYEYGRYPTKDGTKGRVRFVAVSKVVIGEDGKPTQKSLNKVMGQISANSGQGGKIEGAYIISDQFKAMNDYAQEKLKESNPGNPDYNKDRDPYTLSGNNCGTFASDVICKDPTVDNPSISNPTPTNIVDEYQEEGNARVQYDPKTKKTTIGKGDESDAKKTPKKK